MNNSTSAAAYLKQVAELNPMWRSSDLIDLRASHFNTPRLDGSKSTTAETGDLNELRSAYKEYLNRIQAQFWQMPQPVLIQQLASIDTSRLPELVPVLDRLKTVANCRAEFPKLAQEPWMTWPLFHAFKTAVVLPQTEAGIVRERFTGSIPDKKELTRIRKAVANIEQQYPILYALERNFFQTLIKLELNTTVPKQTKSIRQDDGDGGFGWVIILICFIIIKVLAAVFTAGSKL
jgi:hypothetical protein